MFEFAKQINNHGKQSLTFYHSSNDELKHLQNILKSQPPLVSIKEINNFRHLIAKAAIGDYFLIQSEDCINSVDEFAQASTFAKLDFIRHLAEFLQRKIGRSVIQVSGIEEKSAKLRAQNFQNKKTCSYFGDMMNQFHTKRRAPNPWRMLLNYNCSESIYSEINQWNRGLKTEQKIYTSHEALLLYEQALTRLDEQTGLYYNLSTHFPCLGKFIANSGQHIDYFKKIANPLAIKIGPDTSIKTLIKTIDKLDPDYLPGRITLIPRLGVQQIHRVLPQLIEAVKKTQRTVLWSCDPMSGNTEITSSGIKIRKLSEIIEEIKSSFLIHKKLGSQLNAIHLEVTHHDVTECMEYNSSFCNSVTNFKKNHKSLVGPRLNYAQAMHVMQCIAKYYV